MKRTEIIGNIVGGIGNQMFQYACYSAIAKQAECDLTLTTDQGIIYGGKSIFQLANAFGIETTHINPTELSTKVGRYLMKPQIRRVARKIPVVGNLSRNCVFETRNHNLTHLVKKAKLGQTTYIDGYWQSQRFFEGYEDLIRSQFRFKLFEDEQYKKQMSLLDTSNSVGIHVRRGDYVQSKKNLRTYNVCDLDYYSRAVRLLRSKSVNLKFFVFSDDPTWARLELEKIIGKVENLECNISGHPEADMGLMTRCRHLVIANSTYSWWAAWLGQSERNIIAPKRWFLDKPEPKDLIPSKWSRV